MEIPKTPNSLSIFLLVMMCFVGSLVKGKSNVPDPPSVEQQWEDMEKSLQNMVNQGIKMLLPGMMDGMGKMNISSSCTKDSLRLMTGARKLRPWAVKLLGANAGIVTGMAYQTLSAVGAFDQCIYAEALGESGKDKGQVLFRGKYCTVHILPPLPRQRPMHMGTIPPPELKNFATRDTILGEFSKRANHVHAYHAGLCVPSGCQESDISQLLHAAFESSQLSIRVKWCEVKEENEYTPLIIVVLIIFSFLLLLVLAGSVADHYRRKNSNDDGLLMKVMLSFSIKRNFKGLFNFSTSPNDLRCLYGMRFISVSWIILHHSYFLQRWELIRNAFLYAESYRKLSTVVIYRSNLAVETFFFMSGILSPYVHMKIIRNLTTAYDFFIFILRRIIRLLPSLLIATGFMFLLNLMGSGPLWRGSVQPLIQGCYKNWWTNLLFISNFYCGGEHVCLPHAWYVACDVQLYIFALVSLVPLARKPKLGIIITIGLIAVSMVTTAIITLVNEIPPDMDLGGFDNKWSYMFIKHIHVKPYVHVCSYFVGILSGYLLVTKPKLKMSKTLLVLGWCTFFVCTTSITFATWRWNMGNFPSTTEVLFYSSCFRVAWTLALGWMVLCCATGRGGIVNTVLSWKLWIPLGRLTYLAYLAHYVVENVYYGAVRTERSPYHAVQVWEFLGHWTATYGIAIIVYIMIESPFVSVTNIFLPRAKKSQTPQAQTSPAQTDDECIREKAEKSPEENHHNLPQDESSAPEGLDNPGFVQKL